MERKEVQSGGTQEYDGNIGMMGNDSKTKP